MKRSDFDLQLAPEGKEQVKLLVTFDEYYKKLVDQVRKIDFLNKYFMLKSLVVVFLAVWD